MLNSAVPAVTPDDYEQRISPVVPQGVVKERADTMFSGKTGKSISSGCSGLRD